MRHVWFVRGALGLAVVSAIFASASGLGARWDVWHFRTGFTVLKYAAYGGLAAAVLGVVALTINRKAVLPALTAILIGSLVAGIPWQMKHRGQDLPPIHDITTDIENPPAFIAILPLREDSPNTSAYGGAEIAALQRNAYPDIRPLTLNQPPSEAFRNALEAAREMGWEIVATRGNEGRIEATDRTFWFGFKDDVVIRVTPLGGGEGSRIDVRSVSRVGKGDVGTNARRIEKYLSRIGRP